MMTLYGEKYTGAYDFLYQDKDYEKECDLIEANFRKSSQKVKSILDLGCGTGGHALILAKRGYSVTGVDRSEEMIKVAEEKAEKANLSIKFIKADAINCELGERFDAVISMFAVIGYQTTNDSLSGFIATAKKHLASGGIFLFDCWYGPAILMEKPSQRVKEVAINKNEKLIRFTNPILNISSHTVEINFKLWRLVNNLVSETDESHLVRFFFPQEISYFLKVAGFKDAEFISLPELEESFVNKGRDMIVLAKG